jgi:hypothetical protein
MKEEMEILGDGAIPHHKILHNDMTVRFPPKTASPGSAA